MNDAAFQQCISPACAATYAIDEVKVSCTKCGSLLDIRYDWSKLPVPKKLDFFEGRWATKGAEHEGKLDFSGVWRFRELMPFYRKDEDIVTIGEGRTVLQRRSARQATEDEARQPHAAIRGAESFRQLQRQRHDRGVYACKNGRGTPGRLRLHGQHQRESALFASLAEMQGIVFIGSGKISFGKLSQALDYGAMTLQIKGDFDDCLRRIRQIAVDVPAMGIYLMNSVNPFRLEGQKSIMYRVLEARDWEPPDWVIVPGGNLGNCSAFGKAFMELKELGLIKKIPRLAVINASGAHTLNQLYSVQNLRWQEGKYDVTVPQKFYATMDESNYHAHTIASAIEISRPVNLPKALRALDVMNGGASGGVVREVTDDEILEHRAMVARWGFGCEPASAASVAGLHKLLDEQVISPSESVVCILTGHELKDPNATVKYHTGVDMKSVQDLAPREEPHGKLSNRPIVVEDDLESIIKAMGGNAAMLKNANVKAHKSNVPLTEF